MKNNFWLDLRKKRLNDSKKKDKSIIYPKEIWQYVLKKIIMKK